MSGDGIDKRCGPVSTDEAFEILSRFVHSHFRDGREGARISIPADPRRDDDLRMHAFIRQDARLVDAARAVRKAHAHELCPLGDPPCRRCPRCLLGALLDEVRP